ncbi:peptidoglycan D,D-transpeptidase FtsI family protein [Brachybacterium kimchii]|uniref:Penicillin-binding protein 2 n=1 Tax=Brachybacterium kimchii TaxID=2942909 RepID=A0ABY4NCN8_9MICO|nr:penicillin-binding protein 2 [Brachybacterium kimchii]UQN31249.1 penicillin-binding protein 2 [Brachybacterium kimchii]
MASNSRDRGRSGSSSSRASSGSARGSASPRRRQTRAAHPVIPAPRVGEPMMRRRLMLTLMGAGAVTLGGRLVWVQGLDASARAAEAVDQRTTDRTITALRGEIVDRNGAVLARSVERYDLWVNQLQVGDFKPKDKDLGTGVKAAAKVLSPLLDEDVDDLEKTLTGKRGFLYLRKNVEPDVREAVISQEIPGIGSDRVSERIYPAGEIGANVIGFMGGDGTALAGAEYKYDKNLRGRNGKVRYERGAGGQVIPTGKQTTEEAVDGDDLVLTIDENLQWKSQQVLAETVKKFGADAGSAVIYNVRTGELLALADYPTFDPNKPGKTDPEYLGNQSLSNVFEPGSTGKLLTVACALEHKKVTPSSRYTVPYTMDFDGNRIKDSHPHETQHLTLAGVLKNSSNVGTVQISKTVSDKQRYATLKAFGIGEKTGIGLPGESSGILHPVADWAGRLRFTIAFGQGYSVTPIQMTAAIGAFGNDGVRMQPTIVAGTRDEKGSLTAATTAKGVRACSSETARTIRNLMDNDIDDDTASNAAVPNYAVGGKTGTAESGAGYTASFIGMAPIDDPEIAIGVFVYGLKTFISGNTAAAPAFSELMQYTLQTQGIAPTGKKGKTLEDEW